MLGSQYEYARRIHTLLEALKLITLLQSTLAIRLGRHESVTPL